MPANIRVKCQSLDCKYLNGLHCSNTNIELDPKKFCLTYLPIEVEEQEDHDEFDEEELDEESWEDLQEEDEDEDEDLSMLDHDE